MKKALIDKNARLHEVIDLGPNDVWEYSPGFRLIDCPLDFSPDPVREYADYIYSDGSFSLDAQSDPIPTLDELVEQKVAEAIEQQLGS